jgi:hypothetical protein
MEDCIMHRIPWVIVLVFLLATSSASAALGTYINDPTTITEPGLYIVKQNLAVTSGSVITIAAGNVTLDLSGHLLSSTDINGALILIEPGAGKVIIRNGNLSGGNAGIRYASTVTPAHVSIQGVWIRDTYGDGIDICNGEMVEVIDSFVEVGTDGWGVHICQGKARIVGNRIRSAGDGSAVLLFETDNSQVVDNILTAAGSPSSIGVHVSGGHGNLVRDNTFDGGNAVYITGDSSGNLVLQNVVARSAEYSVWVNSDRNRIVGNTLNDSAFDSLSITGSYNLIEGNQIVGSGGCGILFETAGNNAYRGNMFGDNNGGAVCGPANINAGGNIP